MNKLLVDNSKMNIESFNGLVVIKGNNVHLNISGNCNLYFIDDNTNITFNILDNASLCVYFFNKEKDTGRKMEFNQNSNTNLKIIDLFKSNNDCDEKIINNVIGDNNESNIIIRCISESNKISILEEIRALEGSKNNTASEHVKGLCDGGIIVVLPNMEISTNDIVANHFVTISSYDKDDIFYLNSRGINTENAKLLIKNNYLNSLLNEDLRRLINE